MSDRLGRPWSPPSSGWRCSLVLRVVLGMRLRPYVNGLRPASRPTTSARLRTRLVGAAPGDPRVRLRRRALERARDLPGDGADRPNAARFGRVHRALPRRRVQRPAREHRRRHPPQPQPARPHRRPHHRRRRHRHGRGDHAHPHDRSHGPGPDGVRAQLADDHVDRRQPFARGSPQTRNGATAGGDHSSGRGCAPRAAKHRRRGRRAEPRGRERRRRRRRRAHDVAGVTGTRLVRRPSTAWPPSCASVALAALAARASSRGDTGVMRRVRFAPSPTAPSTSATR